MTKQQFRQMVEAGPVILDGATGSNLQQRGMPAGVCPELWILQHEEELLRLQRAYVEAGSRIVYAPTFSGNRIKLGEFGLADQIGDLNRRLVELSQRAVQGRAFVAGDLTMTGRQLAPMGPMDFEELVDVYKEQIGYLAEAGVDLLVVETMMSLQESRAALIAAKECCPDLPVMVTMTFEADERSLYGTDPETAAAVLSSLGADAVGANCSTGPDKMEEVIRRMAGASRVPIIAKPNAGLPSLDQAGKTVYDMEPEEFGRQMRRLAQAGAGILGGCCGTTPAHIAQLVGNLPEKSLCFSPRQEKRILTSERRAVSFGLQDPFLIVGERINPTGKKKLQEQLREGNFDLVAQFAQEQEKNGALVLDVNMGMSGIDEKATMLQAIEEIAAVSDLPLSLDSSHIDVLEAALRRYPGRALVNSVSLEKEKFERLLPLVKKYGAMFILLPLSDEGLPRSPEEKSAIIDRIVDRALELGMSRQDIVVDGLVTTVGANRSAALETLATIRDCRQKGLATICGLSNISFGLPERGFVNAAFLTMAIAAGLTMAIANPNQELLMAAAYAGDLLLAKEESDIRYISFAQEAKEREKKREQEAALQRETKKPPEAAEKKEQKPTATLPEGGSQENGSCSTVLRETWQDAAQRVQEAVLKGNRRKIEALTQEALDAGAPPQTLLNGYLLPAINQVGELFDKGRYFLPQLIAGAEAMKLSIGVLEPLLLQSGAMENMPVVVIATVQGDIHDIGKNLVALMLKNHGFQVIDLGKDVPKETIVDAAEKNGAQIIALSALMTTTMQEMRNVIALARQRGVKAKIIIGGAVITQDYADEIQADGYSRDAAEAVKLAKRLLKL